MNELSAIEKRRIRQIEYHRKQVAEAGDCGPIPEIVNPERREACRFDLYRYLTAYYPDTTGLKPFSDSHIRAIHRMQDGILTGGWTLLVMFRGGCKSTITENATIWATSYGHRKFVVPIGCDAGAAKMLLDSIQGELETNDLLYEDFPEICHPVRALEGKPQRCGSQTVGGERTYIEWSKTRAILPFVEGSEASGAIIWPRGITSSVRGMRFKRPDGENARPDLVIPDDPQTDESAANPDQVQKRLRILNNVILRLGGHGRRISVVMPATIIQPDDMVDQLSDPKKNPAWQSDRIPMMFAMADEAGHDMWLVDYAALRNSYNPDDPEDQKRAHRKATDFYRDNREVMDKGAKPSWEWCYEWEEGTELSAVQHAYNILIDTGDDAFMAECQGEPIRAKSHVNVLSAFDAARKINGFKQGEFPRTVSRLTGMIDVQGTLLYWLVTAWSDDFTGYIVDYGTFPEQDQRFFNLTDARRTLSKLYPTADDEGRIFQGITELTKLLCGREWRRDDGATLKLSRCLVDANWGKTSSVVNLACRQSVHANILTPSYGRGIKVGQKRVSQWQQSKHSPNCGPEWVPTKAKGNQLVGVIYDTNYWKKRFHDAFSTLTLGSKGCISLYKDSFEKHRMIGVHLASELAEKVTVDEETGFMFRLKPNVDNHYFDCAVGSMVAASMCGVAPTDRKQQTVKRKKLRIK